MGTHKVNIRRNTFEFLLLLIFSNNKKDVEKKPNHGTVLQLVYASSLSFTFKVTDFVVPLIYI